MSMRQLFGQLRAIALHRGGEMDHQADYANSGHISKSENDGFVAVFLNEFSRFNSGGKFATRDAGNCSAAA